MEEKNKKKRMLYVLLGAVALLIVLVGGTYAYFSASVSNSNTIGGNTQNINNSSLRLSVNKVNFNNIDTDLVPYNDLVPAFFGTSNNQLNVANPSELELINVQNMIQNKCVNTSEGYTGCHVYKIAISADQDIAHANLLLGLTVNNHSASDVNVVDKSQWGYVVFTASSNTSATGVAGSGTQTAIADGTITNLALNGANHGAPAAIGDGLVSSPTDNRIDIHNNQKLIGCANAGDPQEVVYYLLVYVNDTDLSQNTSSNGVGDNNYAVGSYSGTLELQALGGKVRACFTPTGACEVEVPNGTLKSRVFQGNEDYDDDGINDMELESGVFGNPVPGEVISSIVSIYTVNHTSIPNNVTDSWDASEEQNGSVMAWITGNGEPTVDEDNYCKVTGYDHETGEKLGSNVLSKNACDERLAEFGVSYNEEYVLDGEDPPVMIIYERFYSYSSYNLYIGQVGGVKAPSNSSRLFSGFTNVSTIDVSNLDTQNVTDMSGMFSTCESLTTLDVSNLDTQNVTDMSGMFSNCESLTTLDVSDFNTQNVTNMSGMFYYCSSLTTLDLSSFDFSAAAATLNGMANTFAGMRSLTSITCKAEDESLICDTINNSTNVGLNVPVSVNGNRQCAGYADISS